MDAITLTTCSSFLTLYYIECRVFAIPTLPFPSSSSTSSPLSCPLLFRLRSIPLRHSHFSPHRCLLRRWMPSFSSSCLSSCLLSWPSRSWWLLGIPRDRGGSWIGLGVPRDRGGQLDRLKRTSGHRGQLDRLKRASGQRGAVG